MDGRRGTQQPLRRTRKQTLVEDGCGWENCCLYSGYAEESNWRNWITRFLAKLFA